jgi:polyferredoxin
MSKRLRLLRRVSQALFLAGFLLLFAVAAYPLLSPVPVDLFLRADPLVALSTMISLRQLVFPALWYALTVVVLTILLGRVFCGWICPMGTAIDACERLFRIRGRRPSAAPRLSSLKFYILIAILITAALPSAHRKAAEPSISGSVGLSAVYLLDPIALLTRTLTLTGLPAAHWAIGMGGDVLNGWNGSDAVQDHPWIAVLLSPFQMAYGLIGRPEGAYFRLSAITFLVFAGIIALSRYARRFWCRNLCPLGALLGWLGRLSPIRLRVSDECTRCMRCVNECKVGAISDDPHLYSGPECIGCYSCIAVCPENAISLARGYHGEEREDDLRLDRRRVLAAMGAGVAAVALPKVGLGVRRTDAGGQVLKLSSMRLIRPPGALAEDEFVTACVRCGECMKICMTNTLQPAVGEGGLEALGTPIIVPRVGPCTQPCDLCGRVCPTRAIQPFSIEEKDHLYLGTASLDRSTCIAWVQDKECLICDEACSYDAISQDVADGVSRPVVHEPICTGCGICEWVCPVEPRGAIRVNSSGDKRHLTRNEQRAIREQADEGTLEPESPYPGL